MRSFRSGCYSSITRDSAGSDSFMRWQSDVTAHERAPVGTACQHDPHYKPITQAGSTAGVDVLPIMQPWTAASKQDSSCQAMHISGSEFQWYDFTALSQASLRTTSLSVMKLTQMRAGLCTRGGAHSPLSGPHVAAVSEGCTQVGAPRNPWCECLTYVQLPKPELPPCREEDAAAVGQTCQQAPIAALGRVRTRRHAR